MPGADCPVLAGMSRKTPMQPMQQIMPMSTLEDTILFTSYWAVPTTHSQSLLPSSYGSNRLQATPAVGCQWNSTACIFCLCVYWMVWNSESCSSQLLCQSSILWSQSSLKRIFEEVEKDGGAEIICAFYFFCHHNSWCFWPTHKKLEDSRLCITDDKEGGPRGSSVERIPLRLSPDRSFDRSSCPWSFAACPPLSLPFLPVYLTLS